MILLVVSGSAIAAQTAENPKLKMEIDRLYEIDQKVQNDIISASQNGAGKERIDELIKRQLETFKTHVPILKEIVQKHGFPTVDMVGEQSSTNFSVLIQHADSDVKFQRQCLKIQEKFVKKKQVSPKLFAFLTDRVNINSGKQQIYGTQLTYDADGKAIPKSLKDPKNVNKRRASLWLEPIEDQLKRATDLHKMQNKP